MWTNGEAEFKNKKVVLVAVPGAFTPTCQEQHVVSYLENIDKLKAKGVSQVVIIASNDAFVMSAWGKANGVADDFIVSAPPQRYSALPVCRFAPTTVFLQMEQIFASDAGLEFSKSIGWTSGDRTLRYAIIIDNGKVTYADTDVPKSIAASGAEGVLAKL